MSEIEKFFNEMQMIQALEIPTELAYVIGRIQHSGKGRSSEYELDFVLNLIRGIIIEWKSRDMSRELKLEVLNDIRNLNIGDALRKIQQDKGRNLPSNSGQEVDNIIRIEKKTEDVVHPVLLDRRESAPLKLAYSYQPQTSNISPICIPKILPKVGMQSELKPPALPNPKPLESSANFIGSMQPTQPIQSTQPIQPIQPIQPTQPTQSIQSIQSIQPTQHIQPIQPTQPTQPIQGIIPMDPRNLRLKNIEKCKLCELELSKERVYETIMCKHKFHVSCIKGHISNLLGVDVICPYPNCARHLNNEIVNIKCLAQDADPLPYTISQAPIRFDLNPITTVPNPLQPRSISPINTQSILRPLQPSSNHSTTPSFIQCGSCARPCPVQDQPFFNCTYCNASYCIHCKSRYLSNHSCRPTAPVLIPYSPEKPITFLCNKCNKDTYLCRCPSSSELRSNFRFLNGRLICKVCDQEICMCRCSSHRLKSIR